MVAPSTAETEYHSMATTAVEVVWPRGLFNDLGVPLSDPTPP